MSCHPFVALDERIRDQLRLETHLERERAATLSDVLVAGTLVRSVLLEAVAMPLGCDDVLRARRASFAHAVALGVTLLAGNVIKAAVGRPRPFERECEAEPKRYGCGRWDSYASFYSLHTATAFASAGFACAMRASRSRRSSRLDVVSCGGSILTACAIGALRIVSDRHYLSDVLVGAAMGFAVGYLVPRSLLPPPPASTRRPSSRARERRAQKPRSVPATIRKVVTPSPSSNVSVPIPSVSVKA